MRKKTTLRLLAPVLALVAFGTAPNAHAQSTADKAAAEALFQAGRSLMTSGRFAEACPKFEASNRLDSGLGTLLFLADCYEKAGRAASAWATFREAESIAMGRSDQMRAQVARDRAVAIEPRLSKLWIKVDAANDPKIVVTRDGEPVPQESWGIALPTDAGEHLIEANSPGHKTWSSKVVVPGEATNVAVDVPALEVAPVTPPPVTPVTPSSTAANTPADQGASSATHTQKTLGIVIGAVGVASLGVGTYFGLHAKAKKNDSLDDCRPDNPNLCGQHGVDLRNQALSSARLGTVFMVGGGAFLVGGVVVYLTAPKSSPTLSPSATPGLTRVRIAAQPVFGGAHLSVQGAF